MDGEQSAVIEFNTGVALVEMGSGAAQPPRQALEEQLEKLLSTPAGSVIYDQLARFVAEWQALESHIAGTYTVLLRLLIEDIAQNPSSEHLLSLTGRLIQSRRGSAWGEMNSVSPSDFASRFAQNTAFRQSLAVLLDRLDGDSRPTASSHSSFVPPVATRPETAGIGRHKDIHDSGELKVNSVYRQHLDRQRDEIEKLQGLLARKVREAIVKNDEFGELLEIERGALQKINSIEDIATLRQIMVGGVEELLKGQSALAENLSSTSEYLSLVETDSERLRDELSKVRQLSMTDEQTGLPNRRAFLRRLEDEIGRAQRYGAPMALAILDLDEFKSVNDRYGHAAGDRVLNCYAEQVLSIFRHHDMVARYGGEEFSVLLPNTTVDGAARALRKVQMRVAQAICKHDGRALVLPTFSAGLTRYQTGEPLTSVIERADRLLYRAKQRGRNRIEMDTQDKQAVPESTSNHTG